MRWDTKTALAPARKSRWPTRRLASVLVSRRESVTLDDEAGFSKWTPITIHFDGSIEPRDVRGKDSFKGQLFAVYPGDLVFSKIDARNGAIGLLPATIPQAVVTSEYPVYAVDEEKVVPEYLALFLQTEEFKRCVNDLVSGTSGRKRVRPEAFVGLPIPLPPLKTQRAIVAHWQAAQVEIVALEESILHREHAINEGVLQRLEIQRVDDSQRPKIFALMWSQVERWSVEYLSRMVIGTNEIHAGKYKTLLLGEICNGQSGSTPYKGNPDLWGGNIPWVSPKDMKTEEIRDTEDHITQKAVDSSYAPMVAVPSVLVVVRSGILQRLVPIAVNRVPVSINQDMRAFTPKDGRLLAEFLACYLNARQPALLRLVKWSTTVQSINKEELEGFPIAVPPLDVQREIVRQVQAARTEIARLRELVVQRARGAHAEVEAAILGASS